MTRVFAAHRQSSRHRRAIGYWIVLISWLLSLFLGGSLDEGGTPRWAWLVAHLGLLVVGLGAAVMVEYSGFLWAIGRGTLGELRETERRLAVPAWIGFAGLLVTGVFLAPDLTSPATALKLAAVLLIGLNGVALGRLALELGRLPASIPFRRAPMQVRAWCFVSGATSQLAWWSAVLVGTLNTAGRNPG